MSRAAARKNIPLDFFRDLMARVYSTSVGEGTLDESPMAYKLMTSIMRLIEPTVEIESLIWPKVNIKDRGE